MRTLPLGKTIGTGLLLLMLFQSAATVLSAESNTAPDETRAASSSKVSALLISLEQYAKDSDVLKYVRNDLSELGEVLRNRFEATTRDTKDTDINAKATGKDKHKLSIETKIEAWMRQCDEQTTAILYLGSHGIVDPSGKLCIAMLNFDPNDFAKTTIQVEWIRDQFKKCKAKHKLLILDACYSGQARSGAKNLVPVCRVADVFQAGSEDKKHEGTPIITLASSSGAQPSWLWKEKEHSLFTYWLIEGLKGGADTDRNNIVTFEELVTYLSKNVAETAQIALKVEQTPVVYNKEAGKDIAFELKPIALRDCIADLRNMIDTELRLRRIESICIPEFASGIDKDNKFTITRDGYELLTRGIPQQITDSLCAMRENPPYECLADSETFDLLKNVYLRDYGTKKTRHLKLSNGDAVPAIVRGHLTMLNKEGSAFHCECRILYGRRTTQPIVGVFFTDALVVPTKDEQGNEIKEPDFETIGMLGVSFIRTFEKNEPAPNRTLPHPLDPANKKHLFCDFRIKTRKAGTNDEYKERPLKFKGNRCDVMLKKGEEYIIVSENKGETEFFYCILVDGLNTLSQNMKTRTKDLKVVPNTNKDEEFFAQRVSLCEARCWVAPP
ncbi:MAG: caspase family protein, partial [Thermoguttaceae bacterium]|nr:caspase family protein [Thermoguttaceae bacterium]